MPMPPTRNTAGFELSRCYVNEPMGGLTLSFAPSGIIFRLFLNALFRIRMATISELEAFGELAMESALMLPAPSFAGGSSSVKAAFCPALKV